MKKQGQVWFTRPSRDNQCWIPQHGGEEFVWEKVEDGKIKPRPSVIVSHNSDRMTRCIVVPLSHPKRPRQFSVKTGPGVRGKLNSGVVLCGQVFGFAQYCLYWQLDELGETLKSVLDEIDSYFVAPSVFFQPGQIVRINFDKPAWGVIASAPSVPFQQVTVFRCLDQYENGDENDPELFVLEKGKNWEQESLETELPLTEAPLKLTVDLMLARTIAKRRIVGVAGKMQNSDVLIEKFFSLISREGENNA